MDAEVSRCIWKMKSTMTSSPEVLHPNNNNLVLQVLEHQHGQLYGKMDNRPRRFTSKSVISRTEMQKIN